MDCPHCRFQMRPGTARIHGTLLGFLFIGLSYQNVYFKPDDGAPEHKFMACESKKQAFYCDECETLVIGGPSQKNE